MTEHNVENLTTSDSSLYGSITVEKLEGGKQYITQSTYNIGKPLLSTSKQSSPRVIHELGRHEPSLDREPSSPISTEASKPAFILQGEPQISKTPRFPHDTDSSPPESDATPTHTTITAPIPNKIQEATKNEPTSGETGMPKQTERVHSQKPFAGSSMPTTESTHTPEDFNTSPTKLSQTDTQTAANNQHVRQHESEPLHSDTSCYIDTGLFTGEAPTIAPDEMKPQVSDSKPTEESVPEQEEVKAPKKKKSIKKKPTQPEEEKAPEKLPQLEEIAPIQPDVPQTKPKQAPIKLQPVKIERKTMEPQKPQFAVPKEETPQFTSVKLKKVTTAPRKESQQVQLPKFLLKSRIQRIEYPPATLHLSITELEPIEVDNGILSRNPEEALKIKKKKVKKIKLSDVETAEKEEYIPFVDEKPEKPEDVSETKLSRQPKEEKVEEAEEPIKIKLGKGKVPQAELTEEHVTLKKKPKSVEDVPEEPAKKPKAPKLEEPSKRKEPEDADFSLEPFKPIEPSESEELDVPDQPKEEETAEKPVEPTKKRKPKPAVPKEQDVPEEK
ncbi:unnamed protein product, partial [Nesidiocoris tenuis]